MSHGRRLFKRIAEAVAGSQPAVQFGLQARRGQRLILAYHNLVAGEESPSHGDRSLHLPISLFREQLDAIASAGLVIVGLDDVADSRDPRIVITFDDAYAGALQLGVPELARRGLPATMFVAPGILAQPSTWWDLLSLPGADAVPERTRERILTRYQGRGPAALAAADAEGWPVQDALPEHRIGTASELLKALDSHPGLAVGNHTWSHPNLAAVASESESAAVAEVTSAHEWLTEHCQDRVVPILAYPYGLENSRARAVVAAAGLRAAVRVSGGWDNRVSDPYALPRLNITPGLSIAGFRARLAGLLQ